jgi:hypothetical protein
MIERSSLCHPPHSGTGWRIQIFSGQQIITDVRFTLRLIDIVGFGGRRVDLVAFTAIYTRLR